MTDPQLPTGEPPEQLSSLIREYPGLMLAGGAVAGILLGALLPRHAGRKLAKGAVALAAAASEVGATLGQQALDKAEEAAREGRAKLADLSESAGDAGRRASDVVSEAGRRAGDAVADAGGSAKDNALWLAKKAVDLVSSARH